MPDHILARTIEPSISPVTLEEAKADLRVQHNADDNLIEAFIAAATEYVDVPNGAVSKALVTQTWRLSLPRPDEGQRINLPITPVQQVESISYYDADGLEQALAVDDFHLYGDEFWAYITPKHSVRWPNVADRLDAISVTFIAGFGDDPTYVPEGIRQIIRLLVVHWYENRSASVIGTISGSLPFAVEALIKANRKGRLY